MRLPWWTKIRRAEIDANLREQFEALGETLISLRLAPLAPADQMVGAQLQNLVVGPLVHSAVSSHQTEAAAWLREKRDIQKQREDRLETVEWAILIFAIVAAIVGIIQIVGSLFQQCPK